MNTIWLSVSAGNGPEECAYAASLTVKALLQEIQNLPDKGIKAEVIESELSQINGNIRSALIALEGNEAESFALSWVGIIQWIWKSIYRPHHNMNKKLALARLASLFADEKTAKEQQNRSELRHSHWELERGNPVRVYDGETMKLLKGNKNGKRND